MDALVHTSERFLHASFTRERFPLKRLVQTPLPEPLLAVSGPIILVHAAEQLGMEPGELLTALRELEIPIVRADATLDLATLRALAQHLEFALELRGKGRIEIGARLTLRELASRTLLSSVDLMLELERLGHPGLDADSLLDGELAALAVRSRGFEVVQRLEAALGADVIGIEENPFRDESHETGELVHAERFNVLRRGFSRRGLIVRVHGVGGMTLGPMLVNLDEGRGIGFVGAVPEGEEVVFDGDGSVRRSSGEDVTGYAFSWRGACFADSERAHARDFCFAHEDGTSPGRPALFALGTPAGALDREMVFPHAAEAIEMPGIRVGETRFAFFIARATFGSRDDATPTRTATPRTSAGIFTGLGSAIVSAFAPATPPRPEGDPHP